MKNKSLCQDTGKVRYGTEGLAEDSLNRIRHNRKAKRDKSPIRSYFCHACGGYHLASKVADEHPLKLKYKNRFKRFLDNE